MLFALSGLFHFVSTFCSLMQVAGLAMNSFPQIGFVRLKHILAVFPVSKSTWWAGVKSGRFPQPVKLSARTTAWRVEEIRTLIEQASNGELPC